MKHSGASPFEYDAAFQLSSSTGTAGVAWIDDGPLGNLISPLGLYGGGDGYSDTVGPEKPLCSDELLLAHVLANMATRTSMPKTIIHVPIRPVESDRSVA